MNWRRGWRTNPEDRTFFFAAYQGVTQVNGLGALKTAELPVLTSDRSAARLGAQFCPAGHLNDKGQPATGYLTTQAGHRLPAMGRTSIPLHLRS